MTDAVKTRDGAYWFVGASFGGNDDQTQRFLTQGIWEVHEPTDKDSAVIGAMKVGDRIAIKATYVRKHELPFDNRAQSVSVMAVKATGVISENPGNGASVRVNWISTGPTREWYFYTQRSTIWRVLPGDWKTDGLITFAFEGAAQDIDRFRNAPYWRERFGTGGSDALRFAWTGFYEAIADKLLEYRSNRSGLIAGLKEIGARTDVLGYLSEDKYPDDTKGFVRDICPFTVMGIFNRNITVTNRRAVALELAKFLGVEQAVPATFEGIPLLNNMKSWYFPFEVEREPDQIDALWRVFAAAIAYAADDSDAARDEFMRAFDGAMGRPGVAWNLTIGLYWARPWAFLSLDNNSQVYLTKLLGATVGTHGPRKRCTALDYVTVMEAIEPRFQEPSYPVHSYPELSLEAWKFKDTDDALPAAIDHSEVLDVLVDPPETVREAAPLVPYSVDDILNDGCFLDRSEIDRLLERLRTKKNIILQGPPGTGKTWLAKRLGFALMGERDDSRIRAVQFHPNLSYEDFVRGWRPTGDGKLTLADGVFMEAIKAAAKEPAAKFVVVIEEINRGNPAQIFGELLTLLEAGKRTPSEALELCYPDADGKRRPVHIPDNLFVIGTMNIADRSLALMDLALRRRFAFVGLEPRLGTVWRNWVVQFRNVEPSAAQEIERRITGLNDQIASDAKLGAQFRIGHSYVTPAYWLETGSTVDWFRQVVETEIGPLLDEYWFDAPDEARKACERLLQGL